MTNAKPKKRKIVVHVSTKILIGLVVGAIIGYAFNVWGPNPVRDAIMGNITKPMGDAFLQALRLVIVPLVFASLITGVANLGSVEHLGRLGWRLGAYYLATTMAAVLIGQFLIQTIKPGEGISKDLVMQAQGNFSEKVSTLTDKSKNVKSSLWPGIVTTIIPRNIVKEMSKSNMLAIIFTSILFGVALLSLNNKDSIMAIHFFQAVTDASIKIVGWIMKTAPYAVAALMINAVSSFGFDIMQKVGIYIFVVIAGYLLHFFGTYTLILKYVIKIPVLEFYKRIRPVLVTAFSTSSSSATMPTTMRTLEKNFGVPESLVSFSIPLGATVNMDGTALFEAVAALFIAQIFGVEISLMGQFSLVFLIILTSIGVAGVPGGSIPVLMSAMATLGIPVEGIAIVLGVDRLLDMGRTLVNVTGDATAALFLAKTENIDLQQNLKDIVID
ncbi:MAG: dicarboxylate/amino acid:cation symporter [Bdellovibrionaceae bacterium]|nr:dicarboxylate/amino acid:cation symporter [Pseudobdellovibrionaceae bacterium]